MESTHRIPPQRNKLEIQRANTEDKQLDPELAGGLHDEKGGKRIEQGPEMERKEELETTWGVNKGRVDGLMKGRLKKEGWSKWGVLIIKGGRKERVRERDVRRREVCRW